MEIPLNYRSRVGRSSVTGSTWKAFWLGMRMILLVLEYRVGLRGGARTKWSDRPPVEAGSARQRPSREQEPTLLRR